VRPREPLAYSVKEALDLMPLGRTRLYREIADGRIKVLRSGRRVMIRREELVRYLDRLEAESAA
jgi:excisionase family DNA binding protein